MKNSMINPESFKESGKGGIILVKYKTFMTRKILR